MLKYFIIFLLFSQNAYADKMLILKGIRSLLDVDSAIAYAKLWGYKPLVLKESGENYANNPQYKAALKTIRSDPEITAIYGFSGGGYNARKIWKSLTAEEKDRIKRIDILGSPGITENDFQGSIIINIIPDSPRGHMDTPRWLLELNEEIK